MDIIIHAITQSVLLFFAFEYGKYRQRKEGVFKYDYVYHCEKCFFIFKATQKDAFDAVVAQHRESHLV